MKPYRKTDNYTLYLGDAWQVLDSLPANSVDAIVTDPPYEIGFMNKGWDNTGVAFNRTTWEKALRVLKPGGHLLAFNHSRTFHRMAVAIEDAGFEIRDTIMWLYGSGFPKSMNIALQMDKNAGLQGDRGSAINVGGKGDRLDIDTSVSASNGKLKPAYDDPKSNEAKQWEGWGTALKPAYEPILMARKPIPSTVADNVLTHGVGGINIDGCRVGVEGGTKAINYVIKENGKIKNWNIEQKGTRNEIEQIDNGRFPANVIHDGSEEVVQGFPDTDPSKSAMRGLQHTSRHGGISELGGNLKQGTNTIRGIDDGGGSASRFFYTAKASKKDRDEGLHGFDYKDVELINRKEGSAGAMWNGEYKSGNAYAGAGAPKRNTHPTVKPTDLMQYLIRLITPKGATVLDLFMGSGSTGKAAMIENAERDSQYHFIGIDTTADYLPIAEARIEFGLHYLAEKPKADGVVHHDQIDLFTLL